MQTAQILGNAVADVLFDWRYGTDTRRWVERDKIRTDSSNRADTQPYKPTRGRPLLTLVRKLGVPRGSNFVDIGAGKGRVVMIAAQCDFAKVIGVEFSGELCRIARDNIRKYGGKKRGLAPMEIVEADATRHQFGEQDRVIFMYNPFHERVMSAFIANLKGSLDAKPRPLWLIYNDPLYDAIISRAGIFRRQEDHWIGGTHFRVYAT